MKIKTYAPDYYAEFRCAAGDCRYTCCQGWKIDLSRADYNRLRSARKSPGLAKRMEHACKRLRTADDKKYVRLQFDERGFCPAFGEDGLCRLQQECGYQTLPWVCKVFPRQEMISPDYLEKSCSTGCEAVLRLLLERPGGLRFTELPDDSGISIKSQYGSDDSLWSQTMQACIAERPALRYSHTIRQLCIAIVQNRFYSLPDRLILLGTAMRHLNPAAPEEQALTWTVKDVKPLLGKDNELKRSLAAMPANPAAGAVNGVRLAAMLRHLAGAKPVEARAYSAALDNLGVTVRKLSAHAEVDSFDDVDWEKLTATDQNVRYDADFSLDLERFAAAARHFDELPFTAHLMENLLVNRMFQTQFPMPFPKEKQPVWRQYVTLCAVYNFFRVTAVGYMADKADPEDLIHILTVCSRSILHSPTQLDRMAAELSENGSDTLAHMAYLLKC